MEMGEKHRVDLDTACLMREAGIEKPPEISARNFAQIKTISKPVHETIAFMLARGLTQTEIAAMLGMNDKEITLIANSDRMKFEVKTLTYKLFGKDVQKKFKDILPEAIEAAVDVMRDPKAKPAVKLGAAMNFMDRALGRPKQTMEVEGSLIRQLFEKLDQKKSSEPIEMGQAPEQIVVEEIKEPLPQNPNEQGKKDFALNPNLNPDFDKLASWVENNL